ncbi:MAG: OsmC family protein, partial [Proteobacteria bacterium]|nr:OsmC family protein [Pseudomonadota bacterium]
FYKNLLNSYKYLHSINNNYNGRVNMDIEIKFIKNFQIEANLGAHKIMSDQSKELGGDGMAPNPYEYFVASIGLCVAHYVNSFCKQRDIPMDGMTVIEKTLKDPATGQVSFNTVIKTPSSFPEKYRDALLKVADGCKVKKTILSGPEFKISLE